MSPPRRKGLLASLTTPLLPVSSITMSTPNPFVILLTSSTTETSLAFSTTSVPIFLASASRSFETSTPITHSAPLNFATICA
jgi:hypothetical protein